MREAERKVYDFFNTKEIIKLSNKKIKLFEEQIIKLEKYLNSCDIDQKEIHIQLEKIKNKKLKEEEIINIANINYININSALITLNEVEKKLFNLKYKEGLKNWQIAIRMNFSESSISRIKGELLKKIEDKLRQ